MAKVVTTALQSVEWSVRTTDDFWVERLVGDKVGMWANWLVDRSADLKVPAMADWMVD